MQDLTLSPLGILREPEEIVTMRKAAGTGVAFLTLIGAFVVGGERPSAQRGAAAAPAFQVDPLWPKPLGSGWILGSVTGVAVDSRDHVWVVHRGLDSLTAGTEAGTGTTPPTAEACCAPAPFVLEFDAAGALVSKWGGPGQGYDWPQSPGAIAVDVKGNVWIAAAGPPPAPAGRGARGGGGGAARGGGAAGGAAGAGGAGGAARGGGATGAAGAGTGGGTRGGAAATPPRPADAHVLKFSPTGQFLLQIGKAGAESAPDSTTSLNRPAGLDVDSTTNEVFIADTGNRRVVVFDANTGAYKRHWGAYGTPPGDAIAEPYDPNAAPVKQFRSVSCVSVAKDGLVYVCDRQNNRIQVFRRDGTFVKETVVAKATLGNGAVWDVAFSNDAAQRYLFVADGQNQKVAVLVRDSLESVSTIGAGGRWPGHFYAVGSVAMDSRGNLYTGEALQGKRVQKFIPRR
jgi:hypothetical protein